MFDYSNTDTTDKLFAGTNMMHNVLSYGGWPVDIAVYKVLVFIISVRVHDT